MPRKSSKTKNKENENSSDPREFFLMEKLYAAIMQDKIRGRRPSAREFYLMEKLYDAIQKDRSNNPKLNFN